MVEAVAAMPGTAKVSYCKAAPPDIGVVSCKPRAGSIGPGAGAVAALLLLIAASIESCCRRKFSFSSRNLANRLCRSEMSAARAAVRALPAASHCCSGVLVAAPGKGDDGDAAACARPAPSSEGAALCIGWLGT